MEVFLPLMAAACAFSAVRILIASGERGAKTLASRTLRACERWAGRRLESLGRSDMVAALLEGEDWRQASDALAALPHEGRPGLRRESACAALLAAEILAVEDAELAEKLSAKRRADTEAVLLKDAGISDRL